MKIQVLGTGCLKCRKLKENAARAITASGIECEVESVTDLDRILSFDVMMTPALVIDGEVKEAGHVASPSRIEEWLRERAAADDSRGRT
ncbi:MAG TPA: thioredoxin family protein [bacterium]|nr:thioredoxin family protein [bacterium]